MNKIFLSVFGISLFFVACSEVSIETNFKDNPILSLSVYKTGEEVANIKRVKDNESLFLSLEESLGQQKRADPKADAMLDRDIIFYEFKVQRKRGTDNVRVWVSKDKVTIEQGDAYSKIEGNDTHGFHTFLSIIKLD